MRDYLIHTRDLVTGEPRGWMPVAELPTHALVWLRDECDWERPAPETEARNETTQENIRLRVSVELTARALEGRL